MTQTAAVTTEISNSKDDSNNMTTHNCRNAVNSKQQTATGAKACAAPGAVYTSETSVASGCVYTTKACAAHRRIFTTKARAEPTLQWLVLVLDRIREIGSSVSLNICFEILLSVRKKRSTQTEPALKSCLRRLNLRKKIAYAG